MLKYSERKNKSTGLEDIFQNYTAEKPLDDTI